MVFLDRLSATCRTMENVTVTVFEINKNIVCVLFWIGTWDKQICVNAAVTTAAFFEKRMLCFCHYQTFAYELTCVPMTDLWEDDNNCAVCEVNSVLTFLYQSLPVCRAEFVCRLFWGGINMLVATAEGFQGNV